MPTDLPRTRRKTHRPVQAAVRPKPTVVGMLLNSFMVGSVIALFALVLLQESRYIHGEPGTVADAFLQKAQAALADPDADGRGGEN